MGVVCCDCKEGYILSMILLSGCVISSIYKMARLENGLYMLKSTMACFSDMFAVLIPAKKNQVPDVNE